jgi:hypothetical protein
MQSRRRHLCFGFFYMACLPAVQGARARPDDTTVLAAFLNELASQSTDFKSLVIATDSFDISASSSEIWSWQRVQKVLPEVSRSAAIDLVAQSKQMKPVVIPLGALDRSLRVVQPLPSELRTVFETEAPLDRQWTNFREKFSGAQAIIRFSRIGYSVNLDQAVFVVSVACGSLCGSGVMVLMQQTKSGWRISKESSLWIS